MPDEIRRKRDALAGAPDQVHWCDDDELEGYNMEGAGPGGWLNVFGWYVVGSIGGSGNSIVVRADDPAVYYACHEWYGGDISDTTVDFQDFEGGGARLASSTRKDCQRAEWVSVPFTAEGVRRSLYQTVENDECEHRDRHAVFSSALRGASTNALIRIMVLAPRSMHQRFAEACLIYPMTSLRYCIAPAKDIRASARTRM